MNLTLQGQSLKNSYGKAFEDIRKKYDLTINEVMLFLYLYNNKEKDTAKDVANNTLCTKSHVSKSVDNMVNRKFIERITDINDKKYIHLKLKQQGIVIAEEINNRNEEIYNKITQNIAKEDLEITKNTINNIIKNIDNCLSM